MADLLVMAVDAFGTNTVEHTYLVTDDGSMSWGCHGRSTGGVPVAVLRDADIEAALRFCPPYRHVIRYGTEGVSHQEANQILAAATRPGGNGLIVPARLRGVRASYFLWGVFGRRGDKKLSASDFGLTSSQLQPIVEPLATKEEPVAIQATTEQDVRRILIATSSYWDDLIAHLSRNPELMRTLDSRKFEELVAELLSREGMDVELTPSQKDGGRDVLAYLNTAMGRHLFLVECKRYAEFRPVDVNVVRSLYGVVEMERATAGIIVTTSRFTAPAVSLQQALEHRMSLRDYQFLCAWLKQHAKS